MFITVEGGEGVGKSTFCRELLKRLEAHGQTCSFTREPGGTIIADQIRALFVQPPQGETLDKLAEFCLVSAARAQHVAKFIRPTLASGAWIVCDRYADSSRIYQGVLGGVDSRFLEDVIAQTTAQAEPDLTFVLDCSESIAMERVQSRGGDQETTRFDAAGLETYRTVRQGFLALAERFPKRIEILDTAGDVDQIVSKAFATLQARGLLNG